MHYNEITRSENHHKDALLLPLRDPYRAQRCIIDAFTRSIKDRKDALCKVS